MYTSLEYLRYEGYCKAYPAGPNDQAEPKIKVQPHIGSTFLAYHGPTNIFFAHELRLAETQGLNTHVLPAAAHRTIHSAKELNGFLRIPVVGDGSCFLYQAIYFPRAGPCNNTNFGILRVLPGSTEEPRLSFFVQ